MQLHEAIKVFKQKRKLQATKTACEAVATMSFSLGILMGYNFPNAATMGAALIGLGAVSACASAALKGHLANNLEFGAAEKVLAGQKQDRAFVEQKNAAIRGSNITLYTGVALTAVSLVPMIATNASNEGALLSFGMMMASLGLIAASFSYNKGRDAAAKNIANVNHAAQGQLSSRFVPIY